MPTLTEQQGRPRLNWVTLQPRNFANLLIIMDGIPLRPVLTTGLAPGAKTRKCCVCDQEAYGAVILQHVNNRPTFGTGLVCLDRFPQSIMADAADGLIDVFVKAVSS